MKPKDKDNLKRISITGTGGRTLDLTEPAVMGILNVTPDSFYDGGKYVTEQQIVDRAGQMIADGAGLIDIGGLSTRPGSKPVLASEETERLLSGLEPVRKNFSTIFISADTYRASVAQAAINSGADMINDVSGGTMDREMFGLVSGTKCAYILMHILGTPENMQSDPVYKNVVNDVFSWLREKLLLLKNQGAENIIIDPGFGFGKTAEHNYILLRNLDIFNRLGPVLAGVSRKSMVNRVAGTKPETSLNATTAVNTIALLNGAKILRVHDVKEAVQAIRIVNFYNKV